MEGLELLGLAIEIASRREIERKVFDDEVNWRRRHQMAGAIDKTNRVAEAL